MEVLEGILRNLVGLAIYLFEFMGVIVLIISGLKGIVNYFRKYPLTRLNLAKGMAMGLEFKLGSEILRTVVVRDSKELITVAGIILLRAALTFLIHWEIKNEEAQEDFKDNSEKNSHLSNKQSGKTNDKIQ